MNSKARSVLLVALIVLGGVGTARGSASDPGSRLPGEPPPSKPEAPGPPGIPLPNLVRPDSLIPKHDPDWGFSIGAAGSSVELKGVQQALTMLRDEAAARGYEIEERSANTAVGAMFCMDLRVRFSGSWAAALQVATGEAASVQHFALTSCSVLWTPRSLRYPSRVVSPLFVIGPAVYAFRSKIDYGTRSRISPIDSGEFNYLDHVDLEGGAWGIKGGAGVTLAHARFAELSATLEYALFPAVKSRSLGDRRATMRAGWMLGGVRLSLYP